MRHTSNAGVEFIKKWEGYSAVPYLCSADYKTIGWGSLLKNYPGLEYPIYKGLAEDMLRNDLLSAERSVIRLISVPLSDNQFDALVSFVYNLGGGALQRSTLRRKINDNHHDEVRHELMKWVFAGGKKTRGLIRRRASEADLYELA